MPTIEIRIRNNARRQYPGRYVPGTHFSLAVITSQQKPGSWFVVHAPSGQLFDLQFDGEAQAVLWSQKLHALVRPNWRREFEKTRHQGRVVALVMEAYQTMKASDLCRHPQRPAGQPSARPRRAARTRKAVAS